MPLPISTLATASSWSAVTRSSLPSLLRSTADTAFGQWPVAGALARAKLPAPFPSSTLRLSAWELDVTMSWNPSPLMSATATPWGLTSAGTSTVGASVLRRWAVALRPDGTVGAVVSAAGSTSETLSKTPVARVPSLWLVTARPM